MDRKPYAPPVVVREIHGVPSLFVATELHREMRSHPRWTPEEIAAYRDGAIVVEECHVLAKQERVPYAEACRLHRSGRRPR